MRWRATDWINRGGRGGQAMVELIISLVVFMVLVAGIIQIGTLGVRHTQLMADARQDAAVEAMSDLSPFSGPEFMANRTEGPDAVRYSRDDDCTVGSVADFQNGVVEYADPDMLEQRRQRNVVSQLADDAFPQFLFGLVEGRADDTVELWPIVRRLLYQDDQIDLEGHVWLVWTKGIY